MMRAIPAFMLAVSIASPAQAACDTANQYAFTFANQPAATLSYGGSYAYSAANGAGATRAFTMTTTQNGMTSTMVNGVQLPAIATLVTGPDATRRDLVLGGTFGGRTASITGGTRVATVTFTFAQPVRDFAITLHDVDFTANQYRDWIMLTGASASGATYTPVLATPFGTGNIAGLPRTATGSSLAIGPTASPVSVTDQQAVGMAASDNNSDMGTITATFAQPVTSVTLRYGNYPLSSGESVTGQQGIGIAGIGFCPLPAIAVQKTSAPRAGSLGAYNLPGADVVYTLTVTNSGGSPVDASSITLSDVLPTGMVFRNAAFDGTTVQPFLLVPNASGVALPAGALSYAASAGGSWSYVPAAGYDPAVAAIRIVPTGTMAANSSFSIAFVASIR